jgi:hypothetical protein
MNVIGFLYVSLGYSTVKLYESLGDRRASACSEGGLVVKMATVLEECTNKEQRYIVCFSGQKDSMQRIFMMKYFLFTVGTVCLVKRFTSGSRNVTNVSLITKRLKRRFGSG